MIISVQTDDFELSEINRRLLKGRTDVGAVVSFIGLVRDLEEASLQQMTLVHYPGMTEKALQQIGKQATERWHLTDLAIIHRVGPLTPSDQIVLVSVLSKHRGNAFEACEFIMDYLKTDAPFWKKEQSSQGSSWVASRKDDAIAKERWEN